jgi:hypothetical protein
VENQDHRVDLGAKIPLIFKVQLTNKKPPMLIKFSFTNKDEGIGLNFFGSFKNKSPSLGKAEITR